MAWLCRRKVIAWWELPSATTVHQLRNLSSCNAGNEGGSVGIVTEERRQMERFFQPLREIMRKGL